MKRLLALMVKEFRQLKRDPLTLRMIIMVPLMQTFLFGYAINFDVKHLQTVVYDESRSYDSRAAFHSLRPSAEPASSRSSRVAASEVSFGIAPLTASDVTEMLSELKGSALLSGARGGVRADARPTVPAPK